MSLREIQKNIKCLLNGENSESIERFIVDDPTLPAQNRLKIYQNSMTAGLIEALRLTYTNCELLIGERAFNALAFKYVQSHHSNYPDLNHYGGDFPDFIGQLPESWEVPYLKDVARLDWAYQRAYLGPDPKGLDLKALHDAWQHSELQFHLPANSTLLYSPYPIYRIWQLNQGFLEQDTVDIDEGESRLVVFRLTDEVNIATLTNTQYFLLTQLAHGATIEQAYENTDDLQQAKAIAEDFPSLVENGVITDFSTINPRSDE